MEEVWSYRQASSGSGLMNVGPEPAARQQVSRAGSGSVELLVLVLVLVL